MSTTDIVNCATTSTRRSAASLKLSNDLPLNTFKGWKEESTAAGYIPFNKNETSSVVPKIRGTAGDVKEFSRSLPVKVRNHGITACTKINASVSASKLTSNDSDINWPNKCQRLAPTILRTLTSFERRLARAVVRFT